MIDRLTYGSGVMSGTVMNPCNPIELRGEVATWVTLEVVVEITDGIG
jgi:hypothetical protein